MGKLPKAVREALAAAGIKEEEIKTEVQEPTGELQRLERAQFHAEAVLHFLQYPSTSRIVKSCKECGEPFSTYYKSVAYCDYPCLKAGLKRVGLLWEETEYDYDAKTNVERWGNYEPPLVIPPAAIQAMRDLLNSIDQGNQVLSKAPVEPSPVFDDPEPPAENDEPDSLEIPDDLPKESPPAEDDFLAFLNDQFG